MKIGITGDPTSNRSKPIRVSTRIKSSCSDERLPIGYPLPDFQPNRSNFFTAHQPAAAALTRKEGGRHEGGFCGIITKKVYTQEKLFQSEGE